MSGPGEKKKGFFVVSILSCKSQQMTKRMMIIKGRGEILGVFRLEVGVTNSKHHDPV